MFEHEINKNINTGTPKASYYFGEFKEYSGIAKTEKKETRKSVFKIRKKTDEKKGIEKETGLIRIKNSDIIVIEEKWWMRLLKKITKISLSFK